MAYNYSTKKLIRFGFVVGGIIVWMALAASADPGKSPKDKQTAQDLQIIDFFYQADKVQTVFGPYSGPRVQANSTASLVLDQPENILRVLSQKTGKQGTIYTRYRQYYRGVPVWPGQVAMVERTQARVVNGQAVAGLQNAISSVIPAFDPAEALRVAQLYAAANRAGTLAVPLPSQTYSNQHNELIVYLDDAQQAHLAYLVSFFADTPSGQPTRPFIILDALNRKILKQWEGLTFELIGTGPGGNKKVGKYEYGTDLGYLDVAESGATCTMENTYVKTVNLDHATEGSTAYAYTGRRNTYQEINGGYAPLNDAHYYGNVVYNMYNNWYATAPISFQLVMRVHYSNNFGNAFWDGAAMNFGDGDAVYYPLVCLDVTAHEISHGFTEQNSGLIYDNQSGGMNEAFSDMAGEAAEYFAKGSCDFLVAAQVYKRVGAALRYMKEPTRDGESIDHTQNYSDGMNVHLTSGIYNKAFYLLATTSGWNVRKAFDLFFRANQHYWTPNETFVSGALGVWNAAVEYGYSTTDVENAFYQVGIDVSAPYFQISNPALGVENVTANYLIKWNDYDRSHNARISLYYDTDNSGQNGTLIVSNISEDDTANQFNWEVSGLPSGRYYIYGIMSNGVNAPIVSYSPGSIIVLKADQYEPDNDRASASSMALESIQQHHTIYPTGDEDWIRFEIASAPALLRMETFGVNGDTRLWLYDNSGLPLAYNDDTNGPFSRIDYSFVSAGSYYLKVDSFGSGSVIGDYGVYLHAVQPTPTPGPDHYELDNSFEQASTMSLGSTQTQHSIFPASDVDWIRFSVPSSQQISISTNGDYGDTRMWLLDSSGMVALAYNDDNGGSFAKMTYAIKKKGEYYIKIDSYNHASVINDYSVSLLGNVSTPTISPTPSISATVTPTPSRTRTITPSWSETATISPTPTATPVFSPVPPSEWTQTVTRTPTQTTTPTQTVSPSATVTPARTIFGMSVLAFPNPANNLVQFTWAEPLADRVAVRIYNFNGEVIATVKQDQPGQQLAWQTAGVAPGLYLYQLVLYKQGIEYKQPIRKLAILH